MSETLITLERVCKVYQVGEQNFTALNDVSLEVGKGAFMSFVGPSGSGKTTLLNLIGGLDRPTTGNVFFQGVNLENMSRDQLATYRRENIGFIFQTYNLLPVYSVYENILFPLILNGLKESHVRKRVEEMVAKVGLMDQINKKPAQLSGGAIPKGGDSPGIGQRPLVDSR